MRSPRTTAANCSLDTVLKKLPEAIISSSLPEMILRNATAQRTSTGRRKRIPESLEPSFSEGCPTVSVL